MPVNPRQNQTKTDEVQDLNERLNQARSTIEERSRERSRLTGELGAQESRLAEVAKKCKDTFECELSELPGINKQFKEVASTQIRKAEGILGLVKDDDGL